MIFTKNIFDAQIEVKKSKFISFLFPYYMFDEILDSLKKKHPKARHFVYAYRYLNNYNQVVENSSDDGEPKGTSGPPILKVLKGKDIINSAIIVVRYFGGIKLGTGGLVKAYSNSANSVINIANFIEYKDLKTIKFKLNYNEFDRFEYEINKTDAVIKNKEFLDSIIVEVEASIDDINYLKEKFENID